MQSEVVRPKVPIAVVLVVGISIGVILLLLAQSAIGLLFGILRTIIILCGFAAIGIVGLWLWRRGT
ncbi:MAG: hypothetical protein ACR2QO_02580 [Acidimicrobiales bacterium]